MDLNGDEELWEKMLMNRVHKPICSVLLVCGETYPIGMVMMKIMKMNSI